MRRLVALGAVVGAVLLACGSSSTTAPATDGGTVGVEGGATPADGGGVCCPLGSTDPCSACGGGGGGWAPSVGQCQPAPCDGYLGLAIDSHGCKVITSGQGTCCGCPPPTPDGSVDAPQDGPADGGTPCGTTTCEPGAVCCYPTCSICSSGGKMCGPPPGGC